MDALGQDQQAKSIQWMPLLTWTAKFLPVRQFRGDCRGKQFSFCFQVTATDRTKCLLRVILMLLTGVNPTDKSGVLERLLCLGAVGGGLTIQDSFILKRECLIFETELRATINVFSLFYCHVSSLILGSKSDLVLGESWKDCSAYPGECHTENNSIIPWWWSLCNWSFLTIFEWSSVLKML